MENLRQIEIFDSTLRDGAQGEGISFSVQDKLRIVRALDEFGVAYIEAGNPGSNIKDLRFFAELKNLRLNNARLTAFGSTAKNADDVGGDKNVISLLTAETPAVCIVGKSWDLHVDQVLRISREDNLRIVTSTIAYLKSQGKEVIFDAEHFFDGYRHNPEYSLAVLDAAAAGGVDTLCLCDTNGGALPEEIGRVTARVTARFPEKKVAIHCHNDAGCAVASSLAAVQSGAAQVQGTFLGFGERCGNADLSTVMANLQFKCGYDCGVDLRELKSAAHRIAEVANVRIRNNQPYIGLSAFAHKGGMHVDGVQKLSLSFEHIAPERVGNERKFLLSEVSGRGTVLPRLQRFAPELNKNSPETARITELLKEREFHGYHYEAADASFELLVKKGLGLWQPHFTVVMYKISDDYPAPDGEKQSSAVIKVEACGRVEMACADGNGPVHALDKALRLALSSFYPQLEKMRLADYKVRVLEASGATDATTRVLIESVDEESSFTTIGVSTDIIQASFAALVDSFEYELSRKD